MGGWITAVGRGKHHAGGVDGHYRPKCSIVLALRRRWAVHDLLTNRFHDQATKDLWPGQRNEQAMAAVHETATWHVSETS